MGVSFYSKRLSWNLRSNFLLSLRFTGNQSRNILPSALFGSSATSNRSLLGNNPLGLSTSRPSSPPGWGRESFGGANNFLADDALSTVSAPSRFSAPNGAGLFAGVSPQPSQATTPRGSDNTSNSDHDWPQLTTALPGVSLSPRVTPTSGSSGGNNAIEDTFTDDSDSEGSRCLANVTMKSVDKPALNARSPQPSGRSRRKRAREEPREDGGYFMKVVAVVSVVANVVLAFYLGTMMRS